MAHLTVSSIHNKIYSLDFRTIQKAKCIHLRSWRGPNLVDMENARLLQDDPQEWGYFILQRLQSMPVEFVEDALRY